MERNLTDVLPNAQLWQKVGYVFQERSGRPGKQSCAGRGPLPLRDIVEWRQQVGNTVQPNLAFAAAGSPLYHEYLIAYVGDGFILVRLYRLHNYLNLTIRGAGTAQRGGEGLVGGSGRGRMELRARFSGKCRSVRQAVARGF